MRLRFPIIGQGLGPGGNFCFLSCGNKVFETRARVARHAKVKITAQEKYSIVWIVAAMVNG